jgi:hypothetical protein
MKLLCGMKTRFVRSTDSRALVILFFAAVDQLIFWYWDLAATLGPWVQLTIVKGWVTLRLFQGE